MKQFGSATWHLLPGNHDPNEANGLWQTVLREGLPENVRAHLQSKPYSLGPDAALLPSPLPRRHSHDDLTEWMQDAETAGGSLRIGLAHGSVVNFNKDMEPVNPIDPDRARKAGLDYLALGDWHRTSRVKDKDNVWYAGTPEPDGAQGQEKGQALVVDIAGHGASPQVIAHEVGRFRWLSKDEQLSDTAEVAALEQQLNALPLLSRTILRLRVSGALSLAGREELERRKESLAAAMAWLDLDMTELAVRPTDEDLRQIDFGGVLNDAANRLRARANDSQRTAEERKRAAEALVQLFLRAKSPEALAP
jgi:DNA repair exonuclease SbcCD nuclease subunit